MPQARRDSSAAEIAALGLEARWITGFGPDDPAVDANYDRWHNLVHSKRILSRQEIAVALGHRLIWDRIVSGGFEAALVFEDDFHAPDRARALRAIAGARRLCENWDIIKLFEFGSRSTPLRITTIDGVDFSLSDRPDSGLVGYVITARACRKLLTIPSVRMPIDEEVRHGFRLGLRVCATRTNVVSDNGSALGGSAIEDSRVAVLKKRNVLRSLWGNVLGAHLKIGARLWANRVARQLDSGRNGEIVWRKP